MRVLVISRFAIVRSALRFMLSSTTDIEVIAECSLSAHIEEIVRQQRADVVLIETVEASDPEVARIIENLGQTDARLVILAGQGDPRTIRAMMRAGVTGYVLKQSTDAELLAALRSAALGRKFLDSSLISALATEERPRPKPSTTHSLSRRQAQVLRYIIEGYTSNEIAQELHVSVKTVLTYRTRIYEKLEVHSRAGLVQYAIDSGLISIHRSASEFLPDRRKA
jgi:two-component system, NarL family, response regulator NreC